MGLDTQTKDTDAASKSMGPLLGWPGFDAEAAAKLAAPLQAYPRAMLTAYSAWLDAGSESFTSGVAASQRVLRLCNDCWSDPQQRDGATLQAVMLDATREAVTRQTEILTHLQQRLVGSWAPVVPQKAEQTAQHRDAEGIPARADGRSAGAASPAQRDNPTVGARS